MPQSAICIVLWGLQPAKNQLTNCHHPVGPRSASWVTAKNTGAPNIKIRSPAICKVFLQETLVPWSEAEGMCENSTYPLRSLEEITVNL